MKRGLATAVGVIAAVAIVAGVGGADVEQAVRHRGGGGAATLPEVTAVLTSPPLVPPPVDRPGQRARSSSALETTEMKGTLADGVQYAFWTFGGTVPGPFVRVRVGDVVQLRLTNHQGARTRTRSTCTRSPGRAAAPQ